MSSAIRLPEPNDSAQFFKQLKQHSEWYWAETDINPAQQGLQVQQGSVWNSGLDEAELEAFEKKMGMQFPPVLQNFYRCMNGLSKPGIETWGKTPFWSGARNEVYYPVFFAYPNDLERMHYLLEWAYRENVVADEYLEKGLIPRLFPILGHTFLVLEKDHQPVITLTGKGIHYSADNLSKLLATTIFDNLQHASAFESVRRPVSFWLE
jgi:hypothetical protein